MTPRPLTPAAWAILTLAAWAQAPAQATVSPAARYADVAAALERVIEREMATHRLPAVSVALVDDQQIVWARGFGYASTKDSTPATAETVYRVGSVSKLFTDLAVMQLVERGELDLDAPVTRYLPDFRPRNPFGTPITLRQLMAHRSGLVREPPVGNYFETTEPTLAATVASLNRTALVYAPGSRIKYSNAAIAVVGRVLERTRGEPFARYVKRAVLEPLGLTRSAFEPEPALARDVATAVMWTYHGRDFEAPTFQLGMAPAGSMYSTVLDLGRFASALFAGGRGSGGQVVARATLDTMWTPQFAAPGTRSGFGLGFALGELDGRRVVRHGGAIYGFATELAALPDERLGAVVVATRDFANSVTTLVADAALRMMLAARAGRPLPVPPSTAPVAPSVAQRLAGRYAIGRPSPGVTPGFDLVARDTVLYLEPSNGGLRLALRAIGDTLVADDVLDHWAGTGMRLLPGDSLRLGGRAFGRLTRPKPAPAPAAWAGLIGEYGWEHDVLYIFERDQRLWALIEWFELDPLAAVARDTFAFSGGGLYAGERLAFARDRAGRATRVSLQGVVFARRRVGPEAGNQLTITPLRPIPVLRAEALAAEPPREAGSFRAPELVDLTTLDPTIKLDVRYATTNNFLGARFYSSARAFLQRPAAEALLRAHRALRRAGYGLLIHDAYRPWYVTKMFWDATPPQHRWLVADPAAGSRHNRGAAVDLTLYNLATGRPVEMPGTYDELSDRSYPDYPGGTSLQRWHRELLRRAMEAEGFTVNPTEWWHFDHEAWRQYPILNAAFEEVGRP